MRSRGYGIQSHAVSRFSFSFWVKNVRVLCYVRNVDASLAAQTLYCMIWEPALLLSHYTHLRRPLWHHSELLEAVLVFKILISC